MRRVITLGALLVAVMGPHDAFADAITSTVTVIGRRFERAALPAPESRLDPRRLEHRLPSNAIEGLRGAPGVAIQSTTPGQSTPIVRGLLGSAVLVTVDGLPINTAITRSAPNQYFSLVDPFAVDSVKVLRGGASAAFGPGALGGVIALSSYRPALTSTGTQFTGRVASRFATADLSQLHHLRLTAAGPELAGSIAATYADFGDLRTGGGGPALPSAYRWYAVDGSVRYQTGSHAVDVVAQHLSQPRTPRVDQLIVPIGATGGETADPASSIFFFEPNERTFLQLRWMKEEPFLLAERAEVAVGWQRLVDGRRTQDFGDPEVVRESNTSNLLQGMLRLTWHPFEAGSVHMGILGQLDRVNSTRTGSEPLIPRYADGGTVARLDSHLQGEWMPWTWLSLTFAVRAGTYWIDTPADDIRSPLSLRGVDWSTGVGASCRLISGLWLFTNLTRSVRNPNLFDLTTQGPRPGGREQVPPGSVESEHLLGMDGGLRFERGGARLELEGFATVLRDRIQTITIGRTEDGRDLVTTGNLGEVHLLGFGLDAAWRIHRHLAVYGNLNFTYGVGADEPADRIPPLLGQVGLQGQPIGWASLDVTVRLAGPQRRLSSRDVRDPRIAPGGTDGYAVLDFVTAFELGSQTQLRAALHNAFDAAYREHGSGADAPGRNLMVELQVDY